MTGFDLGKSAEDADPETTEQSNAETNTTEQTTEISDQEESGHDEDQDVDPRKEPAFPFSDDLRESWYVRNETLTKFEDAVDFDAKPLLREHGVRNETGREIQDAAVQIAANHPEEIAEYILENRSVDYDE